MVMNVTVLFEKGNEEDKKLYPIVKEGLSKIVKKINRKDINIFCYDREEDNLDKDIFAKIYIEGNDIYKETIMNAIEGAQNWSKYING